MILRCATCPRNRPGPCFVETHHTRHMCESHARGETTFRPLLTGEKELTPVAPGTSVIPPPPSIPGVDMALYHKAVRCPHRYKEHCGCQNPFHCRVDTTQVSLDDCFRCLRRRDTIGQEVGANGVI